MSYFICKSYLVTIYKQSVESRLCTATQNWFWSPWKRWPISGTNEPNTWLKADLAGHPAGAGGGRRRRAAWASGCSWRWSWGAAGVGGPRSRGWTPRAWRPPRTSWAPPPSPGPAGGAPPAPARRPRPCSSRWARRRLSPARALTATAGMAGVGAGARAVTAWPSSVSWTSPLFLGRRQAAWTSMAWCSWGRRRGRRRWRRSGDAAAPRTRPSAWARPRHRSGAIAAAAAWRKGRRPRRRPRWRRGTITHWRSATPAAAPTTTTPPPSSALASPGLCCVWLCFEFPKICAPSWWMMWDKNVLWLSGQWWYGRGGRTGGSIYSVRSIVSAS